MACEQNATYLKHCKEKAANLELTTNFVDLIMDKSSSTTTNTNEKEDNYRLASLQELNTKSVDPSLSITFESTRLTTSDWTQDENRSSTGSGRSSSGNTFKPSSTQSNRTFFLEDSLSTTTLIPPSLFIEPSGGKILTLDEPAQINHIFTLTYPDTVSPSTSSIPFLPLDAQTTTASNIRMTVFQMPELNQFNVQTSMEQPNRLEIQNMPFTYTMPFTSGKKLDSKPNRLTTNRPKIDLSKSIDSNSLSLEQILNDLDMSNFELSTEKTFSHNSNNGRKIKPHHLKSIHNLQEINLQKVQQNNLEPEGAKLSLSLHKFFREAFPSQYWKSVPKLLRGISTMRNYDTSMYDQSSLNTPRKNDYSNSHLSGPSEEELTSITTSMLSIPVLVPVNLSQDDYRRRMSASVLKPTVIPLKEKGKLIPAYVLQFPSKLRSRRSKRSALNAKRLLSLSIKSPNLLYQVIPSLLKIKLIKPTAKNTKKATPTLDQLLMSTQNMMPIYAMPNGEMMPASQLTHLFKQAGTYDLTDFNHYMSPFYFLENLPQHHRPNNNKKKSLNLFKKAPLRGKIPRFSGLNGTNSNQTIASSVVNSMIAMGSSLSKQKLNTPATPHMFGNVPSTHLPSYLSTYTPHLYDPNSYYSPLLYFGNSFTGSESETMRFKPPFKKVSFLKKLNSKNAFNPKSIEKLFEQTLPNITMPANIYVPDDILEDISESAPTKTNLTTDQDHKQIIDHKISNDLMETINSEESRPVELYARSNLTSLFAHRQHLAMLDRKKGHRSDRIDSRVQGRRDLSTQAKINANFFNGTAVKSDKAIEGNSFNDIWNGHTEWHENQVSNVNHTGHADSNVPQHMAQSRLSNESQWAIGKYRQNMTSNNTLNLKNKFFTTFED